ncbi:capsid cement protein [Candidatus Raskinella chloraquaticus]|uniref:capsid cement protein n=1 Tax=Candidatus Raskinella chloraquaticus TaxID=1951219 RepID=UPI00366C32D3
MRCRAVCRCCARSYRRVRTHKDRLAENPRIFWTVGTLVYWDDTNKRCTTVATANLLIGVAAAAVAGGAGNSADWAVFGSMPPSGRIEVGCSRLRHNKVNPGNSPH